MLCVCVCVRESATRVFGTHAQSSRFGVNTHTHKYTHIRGLRHVHKLGIHVQALNKLTNSTGPLCTSSRRTMSGVLSRVGATKVAKRLPTAAIKSHQNGHKLPNRIHAAVNPNARNPYNLLGIRLQ